MKIRQGAQNYLPPPPGSQNRALGPQVYGRYPGPGKHSKSIHIYHSFCGIGQNLGATVVVDSSVLPVRGLKFGQYRKILRNFRHLAVNSRPLKNIVRSLENGHSRRHQSISPPEFLVFFFFRKESSLFFCVFFPSFQGIQGFDW